LTADRRRCTGHLTKYEYDFNLDYANLKALHRIRGTDTLTTRFDSDDYGRRVKTVNPAGDSTFMAFGDMEYCYGGTPDGEVDQQSFSYDAVGNRTDSGAATDTGNRLTGLGAFSFAHDDEGRTLTKSATDFLQTFHWSARSQLDSVTTIDAGDTTVVRYTYDGLGRRISREGPTGFEEYLYDGPHVIVVLDDQQDVTRTLSYYPGVDRPHSLMTSSETYYYATDPTRSVIGLAEFTGAASATHRYRYDAWGKPLGSVTEAVPNPIRFKARWWDEDTELYDFRSRWYDPDIGRFISEDPIGIAGGINVYVFAGNDPVSGWDPFGLFDTDCPDGVYEGATCTLDPLTVDGGPGDFNPGGVFDYFGSDGGPIPLGAGQRVGKSGPPRASRSGPDDTDRSLIQRLTDPQCQSALGGLAVNFGLDVIFFTGAGAVGRLAVSAFSRGMVRVATDLPRHVGPILRGISVNHGGFLGSAGAARAASASASVVGLSSAPYAPRAVAQAPLRAPAALGLDSGWNLVPIAATINSGLHVVSACGN